MINDKSEEKVIISLLAKGLVKLYEFGSKKNNFSELPRELVRGINILAAKYSIIIDSRTKMVELFSKQISSWFKIDALYGDEQLIINGLPSDFCYELVEDICDIEGELDQKKILQVRSGFVKYGTESDYAKFRMFLIRNPIVKREEVDNFINSNSNYDVNLKKIYSMVYDFYEEIPNHYIKENKIKCCGYCGWTLLNKKDKTLCVTNYCSANRGLEKFKEIEYSKSLIRLKRGVARYIALPGIPELKIKAKIEKLKLPVKLYPNFDEYDLEVDIKGERFALDIKDYGNPYALINKVNEFPVNSCSESYIVIPRERCKQNKDYKYILESKETIGFKYVREIDLFKILKEKVENA